MIEPFEGLLASLQLGRCRFAYPESSLSKEIVGEFSSLVARSGYCLHADPLADLSVGNVA